MIKLDAITKTISKQVNIDNIVCKVRMEGKLIKN